MSDFQVVLSQIKPKLGCVAENFLLIEVRNHLALGAKADLVVFPNWL